MNIDKEIEKIQNFLKYNETMRENETYIIEFRNAIENVLSDRETWKKIAEKLAELMEQDKEIPIECMNNAIDWARKEVEKDD